MARHRILVEVFHGANGPVLGPGARVVIGGDEAHHAARVKRCEVGDTIELLDGLGARADAVIAAIRKSRQGAWELEVEFAAFAREEPPRPRLEVFAAAAKGERLEDMIDGLSQVGADAYRPLLSTRTVVDPREGKINRLRRVAGESLKQCGRAWLLQIGDPITFAEALACAAPDTLVLAADESGVPLAAARTGHAERIILLVGPEGGFSDDEFARLRAGGVTLIKLGPNVLRVETAAVVGAAMMRGSFES